MANIIEIIIKAKDQASKEIDKISKETENLEKSQSRATTALKQGAVALGAITAGIVAAKQVWDFSKEGAELEYAASKFDNLAASVGTTSRLLMGDLKEATRGMLSDAELMQSAGDLMSLGLAKTSDQVVRLSRVSAALNMDMNQLVLTLANKTTMRFDQLGVAVDGFDERLQGLKETGLSVDEAFTEAFLQQAEEQIDKVGEKADSAAGGFIRMEKQWQQFLAEVKMGLGGPLGDFLGWLADYSEAERKAIELEERGIISAEQRTWAIRGLATGVRDNATTLEYLIQKEEDYDQTLEDVTNTTNAYYIGMGKLSNTQYELGVSGEIAGGQLVKAWHEAERAMAGVGASAVRVAADIEGAWERARAAGEEYYNAIDTGITGTIESRIEDQRFVDAGGRAVQQAIDEIDRAVAYGLPPETADQFWREIYVESQEVQVAMDEITADQAAQNIANTLGVELEEARGMMDGIVSVANTLDAMRIAMEINVQLTGPGAALLAEGLGGGATGAAGGSGGVVGTRGGVGYRAGGGPVLGGQPYIVGERGPELFVPNQSGQIIPNQNTTNNYRMNISFQQAPHNARQFLADLEQLTSAGQRSGLWSIGT